MKKSIILGYLFMTFILLSSNFSNTYGNLGINEIIDDLTENQITPNITFRTSRTPININGDDDLRSQAINEGWDLGGTQDGTADYPYYILDYEISGYTTPAININHTTLYINIQNNYIDAVAKNLHGIYLKNVTNIRLQSNIIVMNTDQGIAIEIRDSKYNDIWFNDISGNSVWRTKGVMLYDTMGTQFRGNIIYDISDGIGLFRSDDNWIASTEIYNTQNVALYIAQDSDLNTLRLNNLHDNNGGLFIQSARTNYVTNNILRNANNGVYLFDGANFNRFRNNTIESNTDGIVLNGPNINNNLFYANTISNSIKYGITVSTDSNDNLITWNNFINNTGQGIQALNNGTNTVFINNYFDDQTSPDIAPRDDFVDDPYLIDGSAGAFNYDRYPLSKVYSIHGGGFINPVNQETIVGEITVSWNPLIDSYGNSMTYRVHYSSDGGFNTTLISDRLSDTSFQWETTLNENSRRAKLLLIANTTNGASIGLFFSGIFFVDNHFITQPKIVNLPTSMTISGNYNITWEPSVDWKGHVVKYNVFIAAEKGTGTLEWVLIGESLSINNLFWNTELYENGIYYMFVAAYDDYGFTSDSDQVEIKIDNLIETSSTSSSTSTIITSSSTSTLDSTSTSRKTETSTDDTGGPNLPVYSSLYLWLILPSLLLISLRVSKSRKET